MKLQSVDRTLIIDLVLLILLASVVRLVGVGIAHLPVGDEMFLVLAAQSWAAEGTFRIADGVYDRSALFTVMIGTLFNIFGDSLTIARIPVFVFGIVWAVVLFTWVQLNVGRLAAWISAGLFCVAPHAIELSLYCRMYTLHGTVFLLGTMLVYSVLTVRNTIPTKILFIVISILCFSLAMHLQLVSVVGLIALGAAIIVDSITQHHEMFRKYGRWLISLFVLVAACLTLTFLNWDLVSSYVQQFQTPAFANQESSVRHYHKLFVSDYPVLWPLLPLLSIIAIYHKPRFAVFCLSLFITAFVIHSMAGPKAERYLYYSMPFLFTLWGIALAAVIPYLGRLITDVASTLSTNYLNIKKPNFFESVVRYSSACVVVVFVVVSSGSFLRTINIMRGESYYFGTTLSNWENAKAQIQPLVDSAPLVLTTNFPKTLYYFGRFDIAYSKVIVADIVGGVEGGIDPRTGRPAISTAESLRTVFDRNPHGLFVGEKSEWRNPLRINGEAADFMERNAKKVDIPADSRLFAYIW